MAFDKLNLAPTGASLTNKDVPTGWSYTSAEENLAAIRASAYFNDAAQLFSKDDYLYITGADGSDWVRVTSVTGAIPVTVAEFITAGDIADGSVTLPKLSTGITPSHVVKFGGTHTTVGTAAFEDITVTGALATDLAFVVIRTVGAAPRTLLTSLAGTDKITITFSGDPSTDHVVVYQVLRVAV
jgi:hypothetical protein